MIPRLLRLLDQRFGSATGPVAAAYAPGRVNIIGEHTDYNEGFVLPTVVGCGVTAVVRQRADKEVRLVAVDLAAEHRYDPADVTDFDGPGWSRYMAGVVETMRDRTLMRGGFDVAVAGDVPQGAGLSSSAALETAVALALGETAGVTLDPVTRARLCHDVEHHWAGVQCGIMDQMASGLGRAGHALLLDCRNADHREVPLNLSGHALIITDSGVRRDLVDSAYNDRRRECREGLAMLRRLEPGLEALRDVTPVLLDQHADRLLPHVRRRCQHVVAENRRVLDAADALAQGDLPALGRLMNASHDSLRDLYEASHADLDRLVDTARGIDGVLGSRLTGAGWGGCTVTLCRDDAVPELERRLTAVMAARATGGRILNLGPVRAAVVEEVSP